MRIISEQKVNRAKLASGPLGKIRKGLTGYNHGGLTDWTDLIMDSDLSKFISEIWQYKPSLVVLLVAWVIIFILSVIDTHRYRNQIQNHRHRSKHNWRINSAASRLVTGETNQ